MDLWCTSSRKINFRNRQQRGCNYKWCRERSELFNTKFTWHQWKIHPASWKLAGDKLFQMDIKWKRYFSCHSISSRCRGTTKNDFSFNFKWIKITRQRTASNSRKADHKSPKFFQWLFKWFLLLGNIRNKLDGKSLMAYRWS
jgi:hypothetical protein